MSQLKRADRGSWLALFLALLANTIGLWPELAISHVDLNDNVAHFALAERMTQPGVNPLDAWNAEWSFGYPMLRVYQTLPHGVVVACHCLLGKTVPLMTIFVWVRFLAVALLPLSVFATARLLRLGPTVAAAAALLAPLISTPGLYGLEYGSYVWAGNGLFPQSVATHFLLVALGLGYGAVCLGNRPYLAGIFLGLTFLSHFIYGYIGALSLLLLAVLPHAGTSLALRLRRIAWLGLGALLLTAFQLAPLFLDHNWINHSRWEPTWKWDSFGLEKVGHWLITGQLLDHGRWPAMSLLALVGGLLPWRVARRYQAAEPAAKFVLVAAFMWLALFCGRATWGPAVAWLGISPDMQMHRLIGGVHLFLLLAAAIGLAGLWRGLAAHRQYVAIPLVTLLLLYPMVRERALYLGNNANWGKRNLGAHAQAQASIDSAIALLQERKGRVYPGLAANWGGLFKVGDVPFYAFLGIRHVPAVAFLYHSMALTGDVMVRFDEWNAAQYRLFGIRTVVAPAGIRTPVPAFWTPAEQIGPFQIYRLPEAGYFDVVNVPAAVEVSRANFYDVNDRWLSSSWLSRRDHLRLDWQRGALPALPDLSPEQPLPASSAPADSPGSVLSERQDGEMYQATVDAGRASFVLFKMTWHPNWKAYVDGAPVPTTMLSPGFIGVAVNAGRHEVVCRYESGYLKAGLAALGLALLGLIAWRWPGGKR